ncbi:MAG TPA: cation:proton antiporter [Candidatus Limnocylindrales bacterium]|nr:cation:proton antiporter [Candidatus Limnocylindrales bacterium]
MTGIEPLLPLWLLVGLLAASVAVALVTSRWSLPPSVVLILVGLAVSFAGLAGDARLDPDLLLAIVLPGLVFEAAFRTDLGVFRPAAAGVLLLAIPGVVVVAAVVAVVLSATTPLSLGEGFVVGSMVAATDPAAVLSTFRHVRVPARLATTVEMESLINDGTGIVLFALALDLLAGGGSVGGSVVTFVISVVGSAVIGGLIGWLASRLVGRVDDHVTELTITIVLAYGTYLIAASMGWSGVIATLAAASAFGWSAGERLTERAREVIDDVWGLVAFLLTAGVFLLVGVSIPASSLASAAGPILAGIAAILLARAIVVYGLLGGASRAVARLSIRRAPSCATGDAPIPVAWLHVLFWAGLRGAVSVALALSLPHGLPNRELLQGITFGVVLFTLLVQGSTAAWLVRRTGAGREASAV